MLALVCPPRHSWAPVGSIRLYVIECLSLRRSNAILFHLCLILSGNLKMLILKNKEKQRAYFITTRRHILHSIHSCAKWQSIYLFNRGNGKRKRLSEWDTICCVFGVIIVFIFFTKIRTSRTCVIFAVFAYASHFIRVYPTEINGIWNLSIYHVVCWLRDRHKITASNSPDTHSLQTNWFLILSSSFCHSPFFAFSVLSLSFQFICTRYSTLFYECVRVCV